MKSKGISRWIAVCAFSFVGLANGVLANEEGALTDRHVLEVSRPSVKKDSTIKIDALLRANSSRTKNSALVNDSVSTQASAITQNREGDNGSENNIAADVVVENNVVEDNIAENNVVENNVAENNVAENNVAENSDSTNSRGKLFPSHSQSNYKPYSPFSDGQLSNAIMGLVFVVGLVLVCAWFVKRTNLVRYGQEQRLKLISSLPISNKERIILVRADGVELILGVTAQNIRTLHTLNPTSEKSPVTTNTTETLPNNEVSSEASAVMSEGITGRFSERLKEIVDRGRIS